MGEIIATGNGNIDRKIDLTTNTETDGNSTGSTSSRDSRPATGGSGGNGTGGSGTGGRTPETVKGQEISGLSLLTEDELKEYQTADETNKKRILKNARRRQQYADKKANGGQTVKPRKVRKKNEPQKEAIDRASLNAIILSLFAVIGSRPNCEQWILTEKEVDTITEPLSKMLAESEAFANLGEYSNQIALVMACATVFVPRLIVTVQKQKENKKVAITGQHTNTNPKPDRNSGKKTAGDSISDRKNDGHSPANGANHGTGEPWYGSPISI